MEDTKKGLTRRSFIIKGSTAVGALSLATAFSAGSLINPREVNAANLNPGTTDFPWPAAGLDVEKIRNYGFYNYQKIGGCGLGSARALIQGFLDAHAAAGSAPVGWAQVPLNLYAWANGGGPSNWGTICGAIAGPVGVLNLMNLHGTLGSEVFEWYVKQSFPLALNTYNGEDLGSGTTVLPILDGDVAGHSVPDSPLCHISVSKWLTAANVNLNAADGSGRNLKKDRCGKVTGDTAAFTADMLNKYFDLTLGTPAWTKPAAMAGCYDCHTSPTIKNVETKMSCTPCHTEPVSGRK